MSHCMLECPWATQQVSTFHGSSQHVCELNCKHCTIKDSIKVENRHEGKLLSEIFDLLVGPSTSAN